MVQYGTIYGPEYGQPEIINGPEFGQPEIIKTQKCNSYQINVGQGNHLRTRCTKICCRGPYAVFLGRHSAREIHSIALDETHDKNVASFGSIEFTWSVLYETNHNYYSDFSSCFSLIRSK